MTFIQERQINALAQELIVSNCKLVYENCFLINLCLSSKILYYALFNFFKHVICVFHILELKITWLCNFCTRIGGKLKQGLKQMPLDRKKSLKSCKLDRSFQEYCLQDSAFMFLAKIVVCIFFVLINKRVSL